jgi:hypothetical protein
LAQIDEEKSNSQNTRLPSVKESEKAKLDAEIKTLLNKDIGDNYQKLYKKYGKEDDIDIGKLLNNGIQKNIANVKPKQVSY